MARLAPADIGGGVIAWIATLLALLAGAPSAPAWGEAVREMGDRQLAGQRILTGFSGQDIPPDLAAMIREGRVAGVVLFSNNFDSDAEAEALIDRLRAIERPRGLRQPLLVAIDQEGGLVKRLSGPPSLSAEQMGAAGPLSAANQGSTTGRYLDGLGFNLDFAPVLDLAFPGGEIERTDRGFSPAPVVARRTALAFTKRLRREGVAATAKHFPGFGRATANTDDVAQTIPVSRKRLRDEDERPFRAFAREHGDVIMLANAVYPAFDPRRPAGLSRVVASHELRRVVGFRGVSVTDSLDAAAITALGTPEEVAGMAARAGTDLLLFPSLSSAARAGTSLARELRAGQLDRRPFRTSVARILRLRDSLRG
ncbi:MAG: glycoside hydrolase family 3 N-terminal domain-containing protein [Solirubrobacterales bacterium]